MVLGFHINKVIEAHQQSQASVKQKPQHGAEKIDKLIKLNLNDLIRLERRNSQMVTNDNTSLMKSGTKDDFVEAVKQTGRLLNDNEIKGGDISMEFLKNFTSPMLSKHVEDLELSILNLDFEKGLEALSLLEIAKSEYSVNFKPFGVLAKFLKLKNIFLTNFLREKMTKPKLLERIDMLYQTGYVDISEQLFYSGYSQILEERRRYIFKNYTLASNIELATETKIKSKKHKDAQNPYLMPDQGKEINYQQRINTESTDSNFGMGFNQSTFAWMDINGGNMENQTGHNYNDNSSSNGTINENDIKNYFKSIFDLMEEMITVQKEKFNFCNSVPLVGPNFKIDTKNGQKRKIRWFNTENYSRNSTNVYNNIANTQNQVKGEQSKPEVDSKGIFQTKKMTFQIGQNFGLWFVKEMEMSFNQLFLNLSDQILGDAKILADASEVVKISLGEYDSIGLSAEFILEEFIQG